MEKIVVIEQRKINKKTYLVPNYNLFGCQKYMLPKLDNAVVQHVFFGPKDIQQLYKQKNMDPEQLQCNLNFDLQTKISERKNSTTNEQQNQNNSASSVTQNIRKQSVKQKIKYRPKLRQNGPTHFIHIPLAEQIGDSFQSLIKPHIQQQNRDVLVNKLTLHATILAFRLGSLQDIPKWEKIVKNINFKKLGKVYVKGVDIFPVKKNYTRVLYLNINGLEDVIDYIVMKAIEEKLINQKQLQHIYFDKQTDTYRAQKTHITLLKTKGDDLIDATPYLKGLGKINLGKINVSKISMSIIGSFDGKGYFDEFVHEVQ